MIAKLAGLLDSAGSDSAIVDVGGVGYLVFCSGHFISYEGDKCERLHGHNYRATVEIEGDLNEDSYVFDFIALNHPLNDFKITPT